jgi:hypothetical protein
MWIQFTCKQKSRFVIRPFVGGINAISGEPMTGDMTTLLRKLSSISQKQDYLVFPKQHWLDGIATSPGVIKQFVATPMLSPAQQEMRKAMRRENELAKRLNPTSNHKDFELGASIELQLTGNDRTGGFQLGIIPEFDVERMSFSQSSNMWHSETETATFGKRYHSTNGGLNVLKSPRELALQNGSIVHMKDLEKLAPNRAKVLSDLWLEASDTDRIPDGVAIEVARSTWEACLNIFCDEHARSHALQVEVRLLTNVVAFRLTIQGASRRSF